MRILTTFLLVAAASPGLAQPAWEAQTVDAMALVTFELGPSAAWTGPSIAFGCTRDAPDAFTVEMTYPVARARTRLPPEARTQDRRLGMGCPGPIVPYSRSEMARLTFRTRNGTFATPAMVDENFVQSAEPLSRRSEPPCDIATYGIDPNMARLGITSADETDVAGIVDLLIASPQGDLTIEVAGRSDALSFPLAGASALLAEAKAFCAAPP